MNNVLIALLLTVGFFGGVALLVGWALLVAKIKNTAVALTVLLAPLVSVVFVLAYIYAESM